jgi:hypothetical protein
MNERTTDPLSLTAYWNRAKETVFSNPRRRTVVETILEADDDVYTTSALADLTADRLADKGEIDDPDDWEAGDLSPLLPFIEDIGIIQRLPKPEREDQFYSSQIEYVTSWLEDQDFSSEAPTYVPEGRAACMIHYLGTAFQQDVPAPTAELYREQEDAKVASLIPTEALFYSQLQQVADIRDPEVDIAIANLDALRDTSYYTWLTERLDLGIKLPDADDPYNDHSRTHDITICGLVDGVYRYGSVADIERKVAIQVVTMAAISQQMYTESRRSDSDEKGRLSSETLDIDALIEEDSEDSVDGALRKFGYDASFDEVLGRVWFGIYTRKQYDKEKQIQ